MKQLLRVGIVVVTTLAAQALFADTVALKDGTVREGKVVAQSDTEVRLHVNQDGMQATISIPMANVAKITLGPVKAATPSTPATPVNPATSPTPAVPHPTPAHPTTAPAPLHPPTAATPGHPATAAAVGGPSLPPTGGFLVEMGSALVGRGPGDPRRLPPEIQATWKEVINLDAAGKRANELDAMRSLEQIFASAPDGIARLDGVSRHERDQPFGLWMASVHWEVLAANTRGGNFDLTDVRDVERPFLIGLFKEKSVPALEPLKTYFPPVDEKTGKQAAFKPAQLQGITVDNALDVKEKASLARAILLAQIKLQPDMPAADKTLIFGQMGNINHILTRVSDLEPQARAAEQKKKLAEERAKAKG